MYQSLNYTIAEAYVSTCLFFDPSEIPQLIINNKVLEKACEGVALGEISREDVVVDCDSGMLFVGVKIGMESANSLASLLRYCRSLGVVARMMAVDF